MKRSQRLRYFAQVVLLSYYLITTISPTYSFQFSTPTSFITTSSNVYHQAYFPPQKKKDLSLIHPSICQHHFSHKNRSHILHETTTGISSPRQQKKQNISSTLKQDIVQSIIYLLTCLTLSLLVCTYENFDCTTLKPKVTTLSSLSGIKDLAFDRNKRMLSSSIEQKEMNDILSYNEIMLNHRSITVPKQKLSSQSKDYSFAISTIQKGILQTLELKTLAQDYKWDEMNSILTSSIFQNDLDYACSIIKNYVLKENLELQSEIGFHWGSCAYRHCGALADAQESISELHNSLGLYEPHECLFTIDVIERSLRDIYALIPTKYTNEIVLPDYILYESQGVENEEGYDSVDMELINALKNVRNDEVTFED